MVRPLTPLDAFRCVLSGEAKKHNRAYTLCRLEDNTPSTLSILGTCLAGVTVRGKPSVWVWPRRADIGALAGVRPRSPGRRSWELTHLLVRPGDEERLMELLDRVSEAVGSYGGEKVFIRLLREDSAVGVARHSGFFPRVPEVLYQARPQDLRDVCPHASEEHGIPLRRKRSQDEYNLFRLYHASTPPEVRYATGMTLDQWADSREYSRRPFREYVLEGEGRLGGWLSLARASGAGHLSAMTDAEHEGCLPEMVGFALARLKDARSIYSLVPEYNIALQRVLAEKGFTPVSDYVTLVKTITVSAAKREACVRVAAPTA